MPELTAERLRTLLSYDPETGAFTRLCRMSSNAPDGARVGSENGQGYLRVKVDGRNYRLQRLAWLHVHGRWPAGEIDHINRVRSDNRLSNLRDVGRTENMRNSAVLDRLRVLDPTKTRGVKKLFNRWQARIKDAGQSRFLGSFKSHDEARDAYVAAAVRLQGQSIARHRDRESDNSSVTLTRLVVRNPCSGSTTSDCGA